MLRKIFTCLLVALVLFSVCVSCFGCEGVLKTEYEFLNDVSEITTIKIVVIKDTVPYLEPLYETICDIKNKKEFLEDFLKIECQRRFSDPYDIPNGIPVIHIMYNSNEYEFINYYGQYTSYNAHGNNLSLNKEQFISLVEKYVGIDYENIIQDIELETS